MSEPDHSSHWAIDRFEGGGWAVLEGRDGETFRVPASWLPAGAAEGDVLRLAAGHPGAGPGAASTVTLSLDEEETQRRREEADEIRRSLPRGPEGDFEL